MAILNSNIKKIYSSSVIILSLFFLFLMGSSFMSILETGEKAKILKEDYTKLHSVQYGLFNSTIWADKIAHVIDQKIDEFSFTTNSRKEIKKYVETILDTLIVEADRTIRAKNRKKKSFFDSLLGSTKQMVTDSLIDIKDLRDKVPQFTDTIMNELERPVNQNILKAVLREKLHQLTKDNLAHTDMREYQKILERYHTSTFEDCSQVLDTLLLKKKEEMNQTTMIMLILAGVIIFLIISEGSLLNSLSLLVLSTTSILLLIPGIMLPMIDIEAKIEKLYFSILDKPLTFTDQILFFKSKSISDLVHLLIESDENKMIAVGVLLTTFSIIFPTIKLVSSYLYFYSRSFIGNNALVRFFALRSTKWSMADVMVVSIFMAYLGLDGVISSELKILEEQSRPINVITTNGTELQVGFFLFLGFVFTSFVLSILVERRRAKGD